jgi:hypothetical protein
MALAVRGSRQIVVDGVAYRWKVRRRPSYAQLLGDSNLTFAVERRGGSGQVLVVDTGQVRADAALFPDRDAAVTPSRVAEAIRAALAAGWSPEKPGSPFRVSSPQSK